MPDIPNPEQLGRIIGTLADRYDVINRAMTLGHDVGWRRQAIEVASLAPEADVLVLGRGSTRLAEDVRAALSSDARVTEVPWRSEVPSPEAAGERALVRLEDTGPVRLDFPNQRFDAVFATYGVQGQAEPGRLLAEMFRVTKPGGKVILLDLAPPGNIIGRTYLTGVIPRLGSTLARLKGADQYVVPAAEKLVTPADVGKLLQAAGYRRIRYRLLHAETIALHWGERPTG